MASTPHTVAKISAATQVVIYVLFLLQEKALKRVKKEQFLQYLIKRVFHSARENRINLHGDEAPSGE